MAKPRPYQVRVFLKQEFAEAVNRKSIPPEMKPLMEVLAKHNAKLDHTRLQEFSDFVKIVEEHPEIQTKGTVQKLYDLTKNSLANPEKRSYFAREFTLSVNGKMMFTGPAADALIADLKTLGDGPILTSGKVFRPGKSKDAPTVRKSYLPKHHPGTR